MSNSQMYLKGRSLFFMSAAVFILAFIIFGLISGMIQKASMQEADRLILISTLQAVLVFILPSLLCMWFAGKSPATTWNLSKAPSIISLVGIIVVLGVVTPALNFIIQWNDSIEFIGAFKEFGDKMRIMEERAAETTDQILQGTSFSGLIIRIIVIGLLTAIGEEFFFRGLLLKYFLGSGLSRNVSVWLSAIIFSLVHFQPFGFFPRLLLGAFFGYLFVWSMNLWLPIFAHFLNNTIVVISAWVVERGITEFNYDQWGLTGKESTLTIAFSVCLTALSVYFLKRQITSYNGKKR